VFEHDGSDKLSSRTEDVYTHMRKTLAAYELLDFTACEVLFTDYDSDDVSFVLRKTTPIVPKTIVFNFNLGELELADLA
jgi:hypothetical protein